MKSLLLPGFLLCTFSLFAQRDSLTKEEKNYPDSFLIKLQRNVGYPMPSFHYKADDGRWFNNDSLKNKVVLVNFWFEACAPCLAEMDAFSGLYKKFEHNPHFLLLTFTYENDENIKRIKTEHQLPFLVLSIPRSECYRLNFNSGFPLNYILDKNGNISFIRSGGNINKAGAQKDFDELYIPEVEKALHEK